MAKQTFEPEVAKEPSKETVVRGQFRAVEAAAAIRYRSKKKKGKKTVYRRYTALGPLLKPECKRIDYILVHEKKTIDENTDEKKKKDIRKKMAMRQRFEDALRKEGFIIKEIEVEKDNHMLVYTLLHCPFPRLCKEAEKIKLEMRLKGCKIPPAKLKNRITQFIEDHFVTDEEDDYISAPFKVNKIDKFQDFENPTIFFRPSQRSFLTHHILINLDIRKEEEKTTGTSCKIGSTNKKDMLQLQVVEDVLMDFCSCCPGLFTKSEENKEDIVLSKMGLPYLKMKRVYIDSFVLHEDSKLRRRQEITEETNIEADKIAIDNYEKDEKWETHKDPRQVLDEIWTKVWKFQPMWEIRNYFGEKIALYFAWAGLMITSLWLPMFFGLACFLYGLSVSVERASDDTTMPTNLTAQQEIRWQMGQLYDELRGSFDNKVTPFFAFVICLWGTVFLEFWKRYNATLAYEWDVDQYEQNQPDRPEFFGTKVKPDPVTQYDNWFYPFKRQMLKFFLSTSALILMICIVFISLAGVVVYRVIVSVDYCTDMSPVECLMTTNVVSALLNAVSILILGRIYDKVAFTLTDWENHRTQTQYDDALIIKLFAFQFANSYASCFYIAFFRGRFDEAGVFGLGEEYNDSCEGGNCMSQLSFQVFILMLAKPFPKFFKDIVLPFLKRRWSRLSLFCRTRCCKNKVDEEKNVGEKVSFDKPQIEYICKEYKKTPLEDFTLGEYTEKIIMYGFLMLFAASFPLAPLIALVWLFMDKYIDVKRLLWFNRRPVALIAQDIGMWYSILNFVNLVGVVSNGFLIAFTSSWGVKYDIVTRLWICIGFEHIVFSLKFILAYMIPDIPKDVRLAMRREKFQVSEIFEDKNKTLDYTELVPQTSYDHKALENSKNYIDFPNPEEAEDEETKEDNSNPMKTDGIARAISIIQEEEEEAAKEQEMGNTSEIAMTTKQPGKSFEDSHGTVSLRGVDPQGSRLFDNKKSGHLSPVEDTDGSLTKTPAPQGSPKRTLGSKKSKHTTSAPKQSPVQEFVPHDDVESSTDSDYSDSSLFGQKPSGWTPPLAVVDPYSVVRQVDIDATRSNSTA